MSPRVLIGGLFHETHTFLGQPTGLDDFQILRDEQVLGCQGDGSPLGGALDAAARLGWQVIPTVDYRAQPSGTVEDEVVEAFWSDFSQRATRALTDGLDAIYLVLHGAMVSPSFPDVEGELLERLRALPGASDLPVFGVYDLHATFTARMAQHADCLVAYRENPHTDACEAAMRAADLLHRSLSSNVRPRSYWRHSGIIWPPTGTGTAVTPMKDLEALARRIEAENADVWAANVIGGFAFADTPDTGVSFAVTTMSGQEQAERYLQQLGALAWELREAGNVVDPPLAEVMQVVAQAHAGLTVVVEPSDNIGGGAPGDGTGLLRAFVEHNIENSAVCIADAEAVERLQSQPIGSKTTLAIGGKGSRLDPGPYSLEVELVALNAGFFRLEDIHSHLAAMYGDTFDMGPCAVVRHKGVTILLTSRKTPPFDLGQWRSQGIEPTRLSVIGVKAAVAHRRAYDPIAARMLWVDTPGPCSSDVRSFPYKQLRRPVFPLDR